MIVPLVLLALAAQTQPLALIENPCANGYTENVWDPRFAPGQRWSYHNRSADPDSTLIISKIDDVPGIGLVIQITAENIDTFHDRGHTPQPGNPRQTVPIAIRRDSLDASVLEKVGTVPAIGPDRYYDKWKKNCRGLTYASTVADAMQSEYEAQLTRNLQRTVPFAAMPITAGRRQNFKITFTVLPTKSAILGSLLTKEGVPVKDAEIEIQVSQIMFRRDAPNGPGITEPLKIKTGADGSFQLPMLPYIGEYSVKLEMDGFKPAIGKMTLISPNTPINFSIQLDH